MLIHVERTTTQYLKQVAVQYLMTVNELAELLTPRCIDPGDLCFRPWVGGIVEIWRDFSSRDKTLPSPGAAGPRRWPEGQLSPRAGSMSLSHSATSLWGWGFHTFRGGIDVFDPGSWSCRDMEGFLIRG